MPSDEYHPMRDDELGRLIAYVKSVPPVNNTTPPRTLYPMARVVHTFGAPLVAAERMDHASRGGNGPAPGATLEYGRYMSTTCRFCHGADLAGREVGGEPGAPPSPPIGPTGNPARWTEAQFIQAMRTGVTPAGWRLRNQYMPWQAIGKLSDDELRGIHMYLKKGA
jgi:cytochrome c553